MKLLGLPGWVVGTVVVLSVGFLISLLIGIYVLTSHSTTRTQFDGEIIFGTYTPWTTESQEELFGTVRYIPGTGEASYLLSPALGASPVPFSDPISPDGNTAVVLRSEANTLSLQTISLASQKVIQSISTVDIPSSYLGPPYQAVVWSLEGDIAYAELPSSFEEGESIKTFVYQGTSPFFVVEGFPIAFSRDSDALLVFDGEMFSFVSLDDSSIRTEESSRYFANGQVGRVVGSRNGEFLVTVSSEQTVKVYRIDWGNAGFTPIGEVLGRVSQVIFNNTSNKLLVVHEENARDGVVYTLDEGVHKETVFSQLLPENIILTQWISNIYE